MIGIGIGIPFSNRIGKAVRAKSAVIEASSPNEIVITFSGNLDETSTPATSAFATTPSRTINSVVISGDTVTLTVDSPFEYGDSVTVTYTKPGSNNLKDSDGEEIADFTRGVTNNVMYSMLLEPTGNGTGVSTLRMQVSGDITVTMEGDARFYSNSGGTNDESDTWSLTAGSLRTIYLKCPSNSKMVFSDYSKIINFGNASLDGWTSSTNAANLLVTFTPLPLDNLRLKGNSVITGALPSGITGTLQFSGANINWTYNGALPSGITYLTFNGNGINWTYSGALPSDLTNLYLNGSNINWTYNGALPSGITGTLQFSGANINWTYNGALPSGITGTLRLEGAGINWTYSGALPAGIINNLYINGNNINWTYNGALPSGITGTLRLEGAGINWTGLDAGNGNITDFNLLNYRIPKMSSADMVTFLTNLTNRTGTLPSTITINDFADYASPPPEVTAAVALLKSTKGVLTVALGA